MKKFILLVIILAFTIPVHAQTSSLLTIRDKAACEAAGGVWSVNPLFPCQAKAATVKPPSPIPIPGPLPVPVPVPVPAPAPSSDIRELFLDWMTLTHWAKRRIEIKPQVDMIEAILPPGSVKFYVYMSIGETQWVGNMQLGDRLVIVGGTTAIDALANIPEAEKRATLARILYYLSSE